MKKKTIKIDIFNKKAFVGGNWVAVSKLEGTTSKSKNNPQITVAKNACRAVLKDAERRVSYIVEETASRIAKQAMKNFEEAEYDGVNDVTVSFKRGDMSASVPYYGNPNSFEGEYSYDSRGRKTRNPNRMAKRIVEFYGNSLYFIEFGAGSYYGNGAHPYRALVKPPLYPIGRYNQKYTMGKGLTGKRERIYSGLSKGASGNFWVYKGGGEPKNPTPNYGTVLDRQGNPRPEYHWTRGNKPNRCIYKAVQSVKGQLHEIFATAKYAVYN